MRKIVERVKYALEDSESQTVLQFPLQDSLWAVACPQGKTAVAVCFWAWEEKLPPPVEVRWAKPTSGSPEDWREWGDPSILSSCAAYAHTEAEVQFLGTEEIVRLAVVFYQEYQSCGLPVTNGKGWVVKVL